MRKLILIAASLTLLTGGGAFSQGSGNGPPAAGYDTFVRVCSACHVPDLASEKRLDRAGWYELVQTMIDRGAGADRADAKEIVDYLYANYPAKISTKTP